MIWTVKVGVVVPVRAPEPFLAEALRSALGQDPPPAEVVVVDDGSPEPLRLDDDLASRCRIDRLPEAAGVSAARQAGIDALSTPLVAMLDADDAWEPGKLGTQLTALEREPAAALCFGRATVVDIAGRPTGERWDEPEPGLVAGDSLAARLYEHNPIPTSSVVARRAALEEAGGFDPSLRRCEDWDLWLRLAARREGFLCEPHARIRYRRRPGGLTADVAELAEALLEVHERHAELVDPETRRRARARDLTALAGGRVRQRRYREAREALAEAARSDSPAARDRALALVLRVPGLRAALGRRAPYAR
jgi:glycosyltransferase involved in cell wall biosynthesis